MKSTAEILRFAQNDSASFAQDYSLGCAQNDSVGFPQDNIPRSSVGCYRPYARVSSLRFTRQWLPGDIASGK